MEQSVNGMEHTAAELNLPEGLGMRLAQEAKAMETFARMSNRQKEDLVRYIRGGSTGEEARTRMEVAVINLRECNPDLPR